MPLPLPCVLRPGISYISMYMGGVSGAEVQDDGEESILLFVCLVYFEQCKLLNRKFNPRFYSSLFART